MKPSFLAPCLLFFLLCTLKPVYSAAVSTLPLQLRALLSLKSSLTDPLNTFQDWEIVSALNTQDSVWCSWSGIKCNPRTSQITSLNLSNRNLSGSIPDELRYLTSLIHLNLSRNLFDGPFQDIVFQLRNIRVLDISHNNFNSTFPSGISRLKLLRIFNAYSNSFTGVLPDALAELHYVEYVNLGGSYFEGEIPTGYGNFPSLSFLDLAGNSLEGPLPPQLGRLTQLQHLELGYNADLSGPVPPELGLLTSLQYLDISKCNLSGPIPDRLGNLVDLRILLLFSNHLTGPIPPSLANLSSLQELDLSDNKLTGSIPDELSSELTRISLMQNQLTGEIPEGVGSLPKLEALLIWNNSFTGSLPWGLGSNGKVQWLDVSTNNLTGPLPLNLCQGNNLFKLILFSNNFNGTLPSSLANCTSLARVRIQNNGLTGSIPVGFGQLPNLTYVDISDNNFGGGIPDDLLHAPQLQFLNVSENAFVSALPRAIWRAPALQVFSASFAGLTGSIPEFLGCSGVYKIELDGNRLNGSVPFDIGHCEKLIGLNLSRNSLTGIIPWEISALPSITAVDLSHNRLTGTIPSDFANCTTLETFDVSFNQLAGPIPSTGAVFPNLHPSSFSGNNGLCGWVISRPCPEAYADGDTEVNRKEPRRTAGAVVWIMAVAFGVGLFILFAVTRCYLLRRGHGGEDEEGGGRGREIIRGPWKLTAFQRLNFTADDVAECVSTTDRILGMGSTGTVYKAEMPGGEIIAVKKLWGKNKDQQGGGLSIIRRRRGVLAEVEVLGSVRHRNIVRLLGCCSNRECTMLLYEYMPNGNLDDLLHGKNKGSENLGADWVIRYTIALGVAQGICYLHHDCDPVIVHRDLKPSNILLDGEMEARVADFGVAKLIQTDESMSVIAGSYGYIAPEYAYTLQVDEKSDIYSFGVVLMEIISGKRSVDSEFGEGNSIVDWVRSKIRTRDGVLDVLDKNAGAAVVSVREEMMQMLRIALLCTARNPGDRPSMRDVVMMLQEARPKRKLPGAATVVISDDNRRRRRESNGSDRVILADDDSTEKASSLEC